MDLLEDKDVLDRLTQRREKPIGFQQAALLARELGARAFVPYSSLTQQVRLGCAFDIVDCLTDFFEQNLSLLFENVLRAVIDPVKVKKGGNACVIN